VKYLYLDTEVYTGNREVDLKQVGHAKNARDPLTEVMIVSYAIDNGSVKVWDVTENSTMPGDLRTALDDVINGCEAKIVMHNAPYDIAQMRFSLPDAVTIPLHKVKDTSVMARRLALPAALGELGQVLGIREDLQKLKEGKRLIQKFCKPRAVSKYNSATRWTRVNAKEDWAKFVEYAAFDIHAMREIFKTLTDVGRYNNEDDLWVLDQVINERGIPIDVESIQNAQALVERELERFNERIYRLTGGFVATAAQRDKLLHWLHSQRINAAGVTKQDIADLLSRNDLPDRVREVCEIRQQSSKTSTSKLKKMLQVVCNDGRVRGCLQYYGASRTGRWAGRLIQIQNFARGMFDEPEDMQTAIEVINSDLMDAMYDDKMEVISSCLRGMIAAKPGYKLIVADLSGIEARTLPWLACDEETLDVFRSGKDIYKSAAAGIYKKHYDDIDKGERFIGKVACLALGYAGGKNAFISMGKNYGVDIDDALAAKTVSDWRSANPKIVQLWSRVERMVKDAIRTGTIIKEGYFEAEVKKNFLYIRLPSGRLLCYYQMRIKGDRLVFKGVDQFTRKWADIDAYGGKIVENLTQAVARDVFAASFAKAEEAGYKIVAHVHDELIVEVPDDPDYSVERLSEIMCDNPSWTKGLPLEAKGVEGRRYSK